ncbi:MAG TPA: ornithine carbamoyltransferase, partial [Desulfurella acetivorans]|nr:ornithine carbamoyltransferase [Desulfurella acetivorans]
EVVGSVIDGEHSVVFTQAENRLYAQMAIILNLLNKE